MELSIIIINWNTCDMLRDCLTSVLDHSPQCIFEIIVVDNASSDGSQSLVRRDFPMVQLIENRKNIGFAAANNKAIQKSLGDYFLLLNSDTIVHARVLKRSLDYMKKNGEVGIMGCRVLNGDGSLQHSTSQFPSFLNLLLQTFALDRVKAVRFFRRYRMLDWRREEAGDVETVSGCYMLVRRSCTNCTGLLDEHFFFFGEETDWCKRIREKGWHVHFAPVGEITHFGGGSSHGLNHKRDLMLTQATVRLHLKHSGKMMAAAVFALLLLFNSSRAVYWSVRSLFGHTDLADKRKRHSIEVIKGFASVWPSGKGAML